MADSKAESATPPVAAEAAAVPEIPAPSATEGESKDTESVSSNAESVPKDAESVSTDDESVSKDAESDTKDSAPSAATISAAGEKESKAPAESDTKDSAPSAATISTAGEKESKAPAESDTKDSAPSAATISAAGEKESKAPAAGDIVPLPTTAAVVAVAPRKPWGDDDWEEEPEMPSLELLKVSTGDEVDKPEIAAKSESLNETVEAPETEIRKVLAENTPYTSARRFEDLNLSEELLRGLYSEMGFEKPSRIQAETLPLILTPPYQNLIAQAHNGSGKTTCFVLGMLSRVNPALKAPQALCVCPTRELVVQNEEVLLKMGKWTGITSACTAGAETAGVTSSRRDKIVDQVIIGTPGTLKKWMTRDKILSTRDISVLVFDEADHMLDQDGFQDDSLRIINNIKASRPQGKVACQVLLFSATFSEKVKGFAMRTIPRANYIFVEKEKLSLDVIKQYRVRCPDVSDKVAVLKDRIFPAAEKLGQSIIFARTRHSASDLHRKLAEDGFKCTSIQGGLSHEQRDQVIKEFRSGETKILIATDVLARGFDQAQVTLVVNYDIPTKSSYPHDPDYELYLHRIGRSGRFGRKGAAFNLIANDKDERDVNLIARHFNREIQEVPWDDDDAFEQVLKNAGLA